MDTEVLRRSDFQAQPPSFAGLSKIFEGSRGPTALIVPNEAMNIPGMLQLHATYPEQRVLVLDNNPFNGVPPAEAAKFLSANNWIRVIDHHGAFNDGVMRSTLPRLIDQADTLQRDGFLGAGTIVVTNAQNLDPDGILSFYAASRPETALRHAKLLIETANYTDFAVFGGEHFNETFSAQQLSNPKLLGLALLQLITDEKERFVERQYSTSINSLDSDSIRSVFVHPASGGKPAYDHSAVREIYLGILNDRLDNLLEGFLLTNGPNQQVQALAQRAVERLKMIYLNAGNVTQIFGTDGAHPSGKLAIMSAETGFNARLDKSYPVYDWLQESAGQYCSDAPVHLRVYRGMLVISVRYPRADEARSADYDVSPLIERLNDELEQRGLRRSLYGRKEVVIGAIDTTMLPVARIRDIVLDKWSAIEKAR